MSKRPEKPPSNYDSDSSDGETPSKLPRLPQTTVANTQNESQRNLHLQLYTQNYNLRAVTSASTTIPTAAFSNATNCSMTHDDDNLPKYVFPPESPLANIKVPMGLEIRKAMPPDQATLESRRRWLSGSFNDRVHQVVQQRDQQRRELRRQQERHMAAAGFRAPPVTGPALTIRPISSSTVAANNEASSSMSSQSGSRPAQAVIDERRDQAQRNPRRTQEFVRFWDMENSIQPDSTTAPNPRGDEKRKHDENGN